MINRKVLKVIRCFFFRCNNIPVIRQLGIFLYEVGVRQSIKVFVKEFPQIISIYSTTAYDSNFVLGESDIDLTVVVKDLIVEEEIRFLKKFRRVKHLLCKKFPFMKGGTLYFLEQVIWQEKFGRDFIEKKPIKYWSSMILLYGQELRSIFYKEKRINEGHLRIGYEQVLLDLYAFKLLGKKYFRNLYYYTLYIIRSFFIFQNGKDAANDSEYIGFLIKNNIGEEFCKKFFNMRSKNFKADEDFLILILFNVIKIIEYIGNKVDPNDSTSWELGQGKGPDLLIPEDVNKFQSQLEKNGVKSVYFTKSILNIDAGYLYIIIDNGVDYNTFQGMVKSCFANLQLLNNLATKVSLSIRLDMYAFVPDIFPVIMTGKMVDYSEFLNGPGLLESFNLSINGKLLFGERINVKARSIKNFFTHSFYYNSPELIDSLDNMILYQSMIFKILKEKNILIINEVRASYEKYFGRIKYNLEDKKERYKFIKILMQEILNN